MYTLRGVVLFFAFVHIVCAQERIPLTFGQTLVNQSVAEHEYKHYTFDVSNPCQGVHIKIGHENPDESGDPDLYVSKSMFWPISGRVWSSLNIGSEAIDINANIVDFTPGTYYLNVHGFCDPTYGTCGVARFNVTVTLLEAIPSSIPLRINETVTASHSEYYAICYDGIDKNLCVNLDHVQGDPDLLASNTVAHPSNEHDAVWSSVAGSGNHEYLVVSKGSDFQRGVYYIATEAYCDPTAGPCVDAIFNFEASFETSCPETILPDPVTNVPLPLQNGVKVSDTVQSNYYKRYQFNIDNPCSSLVVNVTRTGTLAGDPDVYISFNPGFPSSGRAWSSLNIGDEHYVLSAASPDYKPGSVYIYVHGFCGEENGCNSTHPVTAEYDILVTALPADHMVIPITNVTVASNRTEHYWVCVPSNSEDLCIGLTNIHGDPDLYATNTVRWPHKNRDPIWTAAGGPHDDEYLFIASSDPDFRTGYHYIQIHSYCDPSIDCKPSNFTLRAETVSSARQRVASSCCTIFPDGPGCASSTTGSHTTTGSTTGGHTTVNPTTTGSSSSTEASAFLFVALFACVVMMF